MEELLPPEHLRKVGFWEYFKKQWLLTAGIITGLAILGAFFFLGTGENYGWVMGVAGLLDLIMIVGGLVDNTNKNRVRANQWAHLKKTKEENSLNKENS